MFEFQFSTLEKVLGAWSFLACPHHKSNIDEEYYWTEKEHARPTQNSFKPMPQGYYEQKNPKSWKVNV